MNSEVAPKTRMIYAPFYFQYRPDSMPMSYRSLEEAMSGAMDTIIRHHNEVSDRVVIKMVCPDGTKVEVCEVSVSAMYLDEF